MYEQLISAAEIVEQNSPLLSKSVIRSMQSLSENINFPIVPCGIGAVSNLSGLYASRMSETLTALRQFSSVTLMSQQVAEEMRNTLSMIAYSNVGVSLLNSVCDALRSLSLDILQSQREVMQTILDSSDSFIFMRIANEIGFPIYLEIDSELKYRLVKSYRENGNQCNKKELQQIILDYYNDDYVDGVLNNIENFNIFRSDRVCLIREGIKVYQEGHYGASGSLFATQMSGMIQDIFDEMNTIYPYTQTEKKELMVTFNQHCKPDSEKGMLLQIICRQEGGILVWNRIAKYFLDVIYSSGEKYMENQPKRHMICHGIQTNYNTKEMNLKQIICLDILTELAWRVKQMKTDEEAIVVEG